MSPADRADFSALIDDCFAAFDRDPKPGAKEEFWRVLSRFKLATVQQALQNWTTNEERAPTPAAIRRLAFECFRRDGSAESIEARHLIERVYAYTKPFGKGNPGGNPFMISLPEDLSRKRTSESAEDFRSRIVNEVMFTKYRNLRQ